MTDVPEGYVVVANDLLLALIRRVERLERTTTFLPPEHDEPLKGYRPSEARLREAIEATRPSVTMAEIETAMGSAPTADDVRSQALAEEAAEIQRLTGGRPEDPNAPIPREDTSLWPVHDITDKGASR